MKPQRSEFGTYDVREISAAITAWVGAVTTLTTKQQELAGLFARRILHGLAETVTAQWRISDVFRAWGSMMRDLVGSTSEIPLDVEVKRLPDDGAAVAELYRDLMRAVFPPSDSAKLIGAMVASMEDVLKEKSDAATDERLQADEIASLRATQTRDQWALAVTAIKNRRDGKLPSDWTPRVVLAGLGAQAAERWERLAREEREGPYNGRYVLALAEDVARKAPERFPLLPDAERARIGEHASARVMLDFARRAPDGCIGEPVWVRNVVAAPLGGYRGKVDSRPKRFPAEVVKYDDEIAFGPEHIIGIDRTRALS